MLKRLLLSLLCVLTAVIFVITVRAQEFPLWEQVLQKYGGKTDATPVHSMKMGDHMQMSLKGSPQA